VNISTYFTRVYIINRFLSHRILNPTQKNPRFWTKIEDCHVNCRFILIALAKSLIVVAKGQSVVKSWLVNINIIFGLDVINAGKVKEVIESWLRGGQGKRIIIP